MSILVSGQRKPMADAQLEPPLALSPVSLHGPCFSSARRHRCGYGMKFCLITCTQRVQSEVMSTGFFLFLVYYSERDFFFRARIIVLKKRQSPSSPNCRSTQWHLRCEDQGREKGGRDSKESWEEGH